jgi:hypothetical protein
MIKLWELYNTGQWVEPFLIVSISLFIVASFILYLLLIESRSRKIRKEKLKIEYSLVIEKLMSSVIFENISFLAVKEDKNLELLFNTAYFREVVMELIINLHKNYEGVYAKKLEQFYKESGLINKSFKKLKSRKWEIKCKGITELAEMNITEAVDQIITMPSRTRKQTLKITALNACIKLAGTKSIEKLTAYRYPIDDWAQLNIINAFKKHDIGDVKGVELLLESQNTTVISLGLKLIKELKLTQKLSYVAQLADSSPNISIQYEAQSVLQALNSINK